MWLGKVAYAFDNRATGTTDLRTGGARNGARDGVVLLVVECRRRALLLDLERFPEARDAATSSFESNYLRVRLASL